MFRIIFFLLFCSTLNAQVFAKILNAEDNSPIPYVNISIKNEKGSFTADENGSFHIEKDDEGKELIFSAVGFEEKTVEINALSQTVLMKPQVYALSEVVITKKEKESKIKVGKLKGKGSFIVHHIVDDNYIPCIFAKYFAFDESYRKTPFLKTIKVKTRSLIKNSIFNIRLYSVGKNGEPEDFLYGENILCKVKILSEQTYVIDISKLNIEMPPKGFFVGIEILIIDKNKEETPYMLKGEKHFTKLYSPEIKVFTEPEEKDSWVYSGSKKWRKYDNLSIAMELELSN